MAPSKKPAAVVVKKEKPAAKAAAKTPTKAAKPIVELVQDNTAMIKIKDLVDRVAASTDAKKKDAKTLVEAVLVELGAALDKGEELNLPGLGRAKVVKTIEKGEAKHLTLKLKRMPAKASENNDKLNLAEEDE